MTSKQYISTNYSTAVQQYRMTPHLHSGGVEGIAAAAAAAVGSAPCPLPPLPLPPLVLPLLPLPLLQAPA